ncbi:DUF3570 domain-containing protein [Alcanivorax sp. VBW004]|jgi:hypothetical protein|uniref:DUF3570 domain-containing protein n=1 Tax=unclassified Alcanivorax TaxID=2638842 RepID=UPI00017ECBA5|nr:MULTISPECIES: DUF3570 domain-containing protein [unclassified Alcanivorax]EDX88385.1 hypothetical protein ADG881_487 [Alcanivorax sp. DG881]MTT51737.1 DUF3570 domain-containing protein [Alcanivorax sp. VBW004]HIL23597.1 DUF3570 domain-containing protein [Alcanivorax sp.]
MQLMWGLRVGALWLLTASALAAVLPEDRLDVLRHAYDGGGMDIKGPSVLVRKSFADKVSVRANYYVDKVSAASIDVVTSASPYSEERTEKSVGIDYLAGKAIYSLSYGNSEESDFEANSVHFDMSQDFFGDLTTLSLGYSKGWDEVFRTGDNSFAEEADRQHFRIGLSQVLTKNLIGSIGHELITDEGYLNNPYRSVRYLTSPNSYSFEPERYPNTRTSEATAIRLSYYLPWRAGLHGEYRIYSDSWGVDANSWQLQLIQPIGQRWTVETRYRSYQQGDADFYADLFPFQDSQNFLARDKELSEFSSTVIGLGVGFQFSKPNWDTISKAGLHLWVDRFNFDYDNFRDIRVQTTPGTEPLYSFDATVTRLLFTLWY